MKLVDRSPFDLVVLDQRIPTSHGQLDGDVIHGRAVLDHVREVAPDTPVYLLTGLPMEDDYVDRLIAEGAQCDFWGDRKPILLNCRFQKSTMTARGLSGIGLSSNCSKLPSCPKQFAVNDQ